MDKRLEDIQIIRKYSKIKNKSKIMTNKDIVINAINTQVITV